MSYTTTYDWIVDSGSAGNMCIRKECFKSFEVFSEPVLITVGNGEKVEAL